MNTAGLKGSPAAIADNMVNRLFSLRGSKGTSMLLSRAELKDLLRQAAEIALESARPSKLTPEQLSFCEGQFTDNALDRAEAYQIGEALGWLHERGQA